MHAREDEGKVKETENIEFTHTLGQFSIHLENKRARERENKHLDTRMIQARKQGKIKVVQEKFGQQQERVENSCRFSGNNVHV